MELGDVNLSEEELARRYWDLYCARQCTIITALFCGQFKSFSQCAACGHHSSKYETFSMLQLPVPKTEMRALSLTISYSNGRVPILCSIRVSVDSSLHDIHQALVDLDSSFNLADRRLMLGVMVNSNVVQEYDDSFRLSEYEPHDPNESLVVFVLPPQGEFLGSHACSQYYQLHTVSQLKRDQKVSLRLRSSTGELLTGVVSDILTDMCFEVLCSDHVTRRLLVTDLVDSETYMLSPGDFIFYQA